MNNNIPAPLTTSLTPLAPSFWKPLLGSLFIVVAAAGFSSKSILIKLAYQESAALDAISLLALRMGFSLPFFLVVAMTHHYYARPVPLSRQEWGIMLGLGFLGYYASSLLDFWGLLYISAGLERLILFLYPTLVVLFSAWIYRQPITRAQRLALGLCYLGVLLIFSQPAVLHPHWLKGALLVFASAVTFALFMILNGQVMQRIGAVRMTVYPMSLACFLTLGHFAMIHPWQALNLPMSVYHLALLMAIIATVIPAFLLNAGVHRVGSGAAAIISSIGPVITLVLAYYLLHEPMGIMQIVGTGLILSGVVTISLHTCRSPRVSA